MNPQSAGVYPYEVDRSAYAPATSSNILAIIGTATRGVLNTRFLVTDEGSLIAEFGPPSADHLGLYAAIEYLRRGKTLYYVRVAGYTSVADMNFPYTTGGHSVPGSFGLMAVSQGSWGNDLSASLAAGTDADTYKITVYYRGSVVEVYDLLKVGAANVDDPNFITTRINGVSSYVYVTGSPEDEDASSVDADGTVYEFEGGSETAPEASDIIGTAGTPPTVAATGMQLFANQEEVVIDILAVPGNSEAAVIAAMVSLCESRGDCICLIDPPDNLSVMDVVSWHNTTNGGISSSYAAIFYPWVQVYDSYNSAYVYIPPSGLVAGVIAYTDYISDPWFAPAGLNRGVLPSATALRNSPSEGERDYMYSNGNVVNPIAALSGRGFVVWGQRTCKRTPSKLDRISPRRLLNYLKRVVAYAVQQLLFEPNDEVTWAQFDNIVSPLLANVQARRGLESPVGYRIVCDETTNPPAVRAQKRMVGKIMVLPTDAAEMIEVPFVVTENSLQFTEV